MKKQRQVLAVLMAGMMMAGILGGCGQKAEPEPEKKEEVQKEEAEDKEPAEEKQEETEDKGVLMMATTTSTADTGLLDYLAPIFKEDTGWELQWNAVGTGEALKMGENGDVDIVLVHAKASEEEFVANGFGVERFPVMYNDFVVHRDAGSHHQDLLRQEDGH